MSQALIHQMVALSNQDGQERSIYELKNGSWVIKLSSEAAPRGAKRLYESMDTTMGWMSREIGHNYQHGYRNGR